MIRTGRAMSFKPYAVIMWVKGEEPIAKTICYNQDDVNRALARHADKCDWYSQFTPMVHGVDGDEV